MKIAQYYPDKNGRIRLGAVSEDRLVPLDFDGDMIALIESGIRPETAGQAIPLDRVRPAPAVTRPEKIIALGLNYSDHARESKGKVPDVPLIFAKFPNSLTAHGEEIRWDPGLTAKVDFEAELAVIVGKKVYGCAEDAAMDAVFGYTCANDVSARDLQFGDRQWVRGKSLDTFCPLGPWIVTSDELSDPHSLGIRCRLNGRLMQDSRTDRMFFRVPFLISFLSRHFTLFPGDVILTGTPSGVGTFREPSIYMKDGDEVEVEIDGIGRLKNTCRTLSDPVTRD